MSGRIVIAGATGYLGRHLVAAFRSRGWRVNALVRSAPRARLAGIPPSEYLVVSLGDPNRLIPVLRDADAVISAVGLTRQKTRDTYMQVDFGLNLTLLKSAIRAGVPRFGYVHVLNAQNMPGSALARAKQRFVATLEASPIEPVVIAPTAYFSDMEDVMRMARRGGVLQIGDGSRRLNPIHGADLAAQCVTAIEEGTRRLNIGGPEVLSQAEIAQLAFDALGRKPRIIQMSRGMAGLVVKGMKFMGTQRMWGPAEFFLEACEMDMIGDKKGERKLSRHFKALAEGRED